MVEEGGGSIHNLDVAGDASNPLVSKNQSEPATDGDLLDEGRSSSLSELEDAPDGVDIVSADLGFSGQVDADSEAETERLETSPPNKDANHKDIDVGSRWFAKSPSKLAQSVVTQVPSHHEAYSDSAVSSPALSEEDLENETRSEHHTVPETVHNILGDVRYSSPKKRKHLDMEDSNGNDDDLEDGRHRRRRTQSVVSDAEEQSELGASREATVEPAGEEADDQVVPDGISSTSRDAQDVHRVKSSKAANRRVGKGKGRKILEEIVEEGQDRDKAAGQEVDEASPGSAEEDRADGEDEDAEAAAKNEEEYAKKMAAMGSLAALEKHFAALRDRLYDERIVALNDETAQLSASKPTHAEYLRQLECIRKYRDEKSDTEQQLLVYKTQSLKTKSVAQRSQIHSAYFQTVRDVREKHLTRIGERLSRLRRDHVKSDEKIPDYSVPFPTRRSIQITQQSSYNKEVSILSGIAKYVGFPAAPNVTSARQAETDEDMEKIGISFNLVKPKPNHSKSSRAAFSSAMSRPAAEEQFLEQNPWANPQHPIHQQHMGRLSRQVSDQTQTADNSVTPSTQKSLVDSNRPAGSTSTIPEYQSAQASSTMATPYSTNEILRQQTSEAAAIGSAGSGQNSHPLFEKLQPPRERPQSLSPTETRKHNLATNDVGLVKPSPTSEAAPDVEGKSSHIFKTSRTALFDTPVRPASLARNPPSNNQIGARNSSSSITLHQHAREHNLTPATGLSKIGAR